MTCNSPWQSVAGTFGLVGLGVVLGLMPAASRAAEGGATASLPAMPSLRNLADAAARDAAVAIMSAHAESRQGEVADPVYAAYQKGLYLQAFDLATRKAEEGDAAAM